MSRDEGRFFGRVYALVREIPRGRVATYGQIAAMLGVVRGARAVGWALRALPEDAAARVPWHRVIGAGGRISPRGGPGPEIQRRRLRAEGVGFRGAHVDLARHGLLAPENRSDRTQGLAPESRSGHTRGLAPESRPGRRRPRRSR
jgi:methylated-DNA-protein-cysteine methyltransferase related protein